MVEYDTIAFGALVLGYIGTKIYFNQKRKKLVNDFSNWANYYPAMMTEEINNKFTEIKNCLEKRLKKN